MKIVLLTTDTTHHTYFAWKVAEKYKIEAIFIETKSVLAKFETYHPFEKIRDEYERDVLLSNCPYRITEIADTSSSATINSTETIESLRRITPDILIVFGTGILSSSVIEIPRIACLNLHGGNPEKYRGLDTHLWAIYHNDFSNLVTTIHYMDIGLDTGDIVLQTRLAIDKSTNLHTLRSINTEACIKLSLLCFSSLDSFGWLPNRKQTEIGRYYSFMPSCLKEDCLVKFNHYVSQL